MTAQILLTVNHRPVVAVFPVFTEMDRKGCQLVDGKVIIHDQIPKMMRLLGFFVIVISLAMQSVNRAVWAGAGVFVGFVGSFIVLMLLWFLLRGRKS